MPAEFDQQAFVVQLRAQGAEVRFSKTGNVLVVDFRPATINHIELDLKPLVNFDRLRELYLPNCVIDDNFLAWLARLDKLQTLDLRQTQVTETGLAGLSSRPHLKLLLLSSKQVSESFLRTFRQQMIGTRIIVE